MFTTRTLFVNSPTELTISIPSSLADDGFYMEVAAANGDMDMVKMLYEESQLKPTELGMNCAAANGHLHVLEWFKEHGIKCSHQGIGWAVRNDKLESIIWIYENNPNVFNIPSGVSNLAVANNRLNILKWVYENTQNRCTSTTGSIHHAIENGNLDIIKFLLTTDDNVQLGTYELACAAAFGHVHILEWLYETFPGIKCDGYVIQYAASRGHLHVLKWLYNHYPDVKCTDWLLDVTAATGRMDILEWIHVHYPDIVCTEYSMKQAIENGHIHVVKWLHETFDLEIPKDIFKHKKWWELFLSMPELVNLGNDKFNKHINKILKTRKEMMLLFLLLNSDNTKLPDKSHVLCDDVLEIIGKHLRYS